MRSANIKKKATLIERRIMGKLLAATKKDVQRYKAARASIKLWTRNGYALGIMKPDNLSRVKDYIPRLVLKQEKTGLAIFAQAPFVSLFHEAGPVTIIAKKRERCLKYSFSQGLMNGELLSRCFYLKENSYIQLLKRIL